MRFNNGELLLYKHQEFSGDEFIAHFHHYIIYCYLLFYVVYLNQENLI